MRAQLVPAGDLCVALGGRPQRRERAAVRGAGLAQLVDRVALADVRSGALGHDAAQRLGELRRRAARLRADDARRAPADLAAQRVLGRDAGAEAVDRVRSRPPDADAHQQRARREVVVGLERGGGRGGARCPGAAARSISSCSRRRRSSWASASDCSTVAASAAAARASRSSSSPSGASSISHR